MSVLKYRNSASDPWQEVQTINGRDGEDCNVQIYFVTTPPTSTDEDGLYFVIPASS